MRNKKKSAEKTAPRRSDSLVNNQSFTIAEAYKSLRTNINFALAKPGECKKIVVCSPMAAEGKTTTAVNLAVTIAQTHSKVILLGCDLRKPRIHKFFDLENTTGVSDVLGGMAKLEDVIVRTPYDNLDLLCSGTLPPNPAELLASDKVDTILDTLSEIYDYIILDTPPLNIVSDAMPLIAKTDGLLLVIKLDQTTHPELQVAVESLHFAGAKILGVVLNGVDISASSGYKSGYKYKHGYGKKYDYGNSYGYSYGGYGYYSNNKYGDRGYGMRLSADRRYGDVFYGDAMDAHREK